MANEFIQVQRLRVEVERAECGRAKWSEIAARAVEERAIAECQRDEARAEAERLAGERDRAVQNARMLAEAGVAITKRAENAEQRAERLANQVAAVTRVLGNDNRRVDADSVAALSDQMPKIARLIADLWLATGAHPERVQPFADQPERAQPTCDQCGSTEDVRVDRQGMRFCPTHHTEGRS